MNTQGRCDQPRSASQAENAGSIPVIRSKDRKRRSWILQYCEGDAIHARTKQLLDDRLLVADNGHWLDEPIQQRPADIKAIVRNYEKG